MIHRTAKEIRADVLDGRSTAVQVTEETLAKIADAEDYLHAFLTVAGSHALDQAGRLEQRAAAGEAPGPLWGVPFSVKDTYDTAGVRTTYGSRVFADHVPDRDAELVRRVRQAGGVLVGKTNTPEFAIYIRTVNELQAETVNPWDHARTTGGSSGGAAASVAAGLTPIAIGSDGGGSVRIPAALCGVVGLMPSRGSIPRGGGHIGTRRFSSAGPLAADAGDALTLWRVMAGPDQADGLSRGLLPTGVTHADPPGAPRMRWIAESGVPGGEADVVETVQSSAELFAHELRVPLEVSTRSMQAARFSEAFYAMMQADRLSTGGRELLDDPATNSLLTGYGRHQFERAAAIDGAAYSAAVEVQLSATEHLLGLLDEVDVLLTPTLSFVAPLIPSGEQPLPEDARRGFVAFTYLMNYTGFPAVTVPAGLVRGLPVGLQIIGRPGSEEYLLDLAGRFQRQVYRMPDVRPLSRLGGHE
ncbi:amidase [Saxibacter everestensis]|uniref:Amidase n=1 Tax=Saxibacter everestensis TaxID=2909229 RepID=A0ABY8QST4_9MICO|nr:amidase [Brevibacteriaceae bacterium ZFBP1038]